VHQFVRIGAHAMTGINSVLTQDVPPYVMATGNPAVPRSINTEGLKRRGFTPDAIAELRRAYKTLYRSGATLEEARIAIAEKAQSTPELSILADFLAVPGRGIIR
jgi:UDP-N-acetylglucosamine acyltransferase